MPAPIETPSSAAATYHTGVAHQVASRVHGLFRRWPEPYLRSWGALLRSLPQSSLKRRIANTLTDSHWPPTAFPPRSIAVAGQEIILRPHTDDLSWQALIARELEYEPGLAAWLATRQYDVILEIGANIGVYTCFLAKLFPDANIYAFEPARAVFQRLAENLALNPTPNVQAYCVAVSNSPGFASFYAPEGHTTNGSLVEGMARIFSPQVARTLVPTVGPSELGELIPAGKRVLVKLDIEAAEPIVLRALEPLLADRRPDLVVEVLDITAADLNSIDYLRTVYTPHRIAPDGTLTAIAAFDVPKGYEDNVLLPASGR